MGHEVKLISPQYVRPFVEGNKNDFIDAEAICEAAVRPTMRFAPPPETEALQTLSTLHRVRESRLHDRTKTANPMYGFLLEFGVSLPVGLAVIQRLPALLAAHDELPRHSWSRCLSGCTSTSSTSRARSPRSRGNGVIKSTRTTWASAI